MGCAARVAACGRARRSPVARGVQYGPMTIDVGFGVRPLCTIGYSARGTAMHQSLRIMAVFGALTAATAGQVRADVLLSGPDSNDGSYSTAQLSSAATSGDTVSSGGL